MNHRITPNRDRVNVNEMMRFLLLMRLVCYVHSTLQEFEQLLHSSEHSIVKIEDSFVSVKHIKRLITKREERRIEKRLRSLNNKTRSSL